MARPQPITGSAGSRVQVLLGATGSDYLLCCEHDNGHTQWQSREWTTDILPIALAKRLKGTQDFCDICFGQEPDDDMWYARDAETGKSYWRKRPDYGEDSDEEQGNVSDDIEDQVRLAKGDRVLLAYGHADSYVIVHGNNGFVHSWDVPERLKKHIKKLNKTNQEIQSLRLFPDGSYFVSDTAGIEWSFESSALHNELKHGNGSFDDDVLDVTLALDGSWIVIRPNRFICSRGISKTLQSKLTEFYAKHQSRQDRRRRELEAYDAEERQEETMRFIEQVHVKFADEERKKVDEARREEDERRMRKEEVATELRAAEDRLNEIRFKRLRPKDRVRVIGFSDETEETFIKSVLKDGLIELQRGGSIIAVKDPRMVTQYSDDVVEEDVEFVKNLCLSADKYEMAVAWFQCRCPAYCLCTRSLSARLAILYSNQSRPSRSTTPTTVATTSTEWTVGDRVRVRSSGVGTVVDIEPGSINGKHVVRVRYDDGTFCHVREEQLEDPHGTVGKSNASVSSRVSTTSMSPDAPVQQVRPLLEHRGEYTPFDEYKCAEKIDFQRLKRVVSNLRTDNEARRECCQRLKRIPYRTERQENLFKTLQRCQAIEAIVEALHTMLSEASVPEDDDGCMVYEVMYEHRDPSRRGRLFAMGTPVRVGDDRYPRTATLQGMHRDLRAALVGEFCYDLDCENSDVRLLCSLAHQLGYADLIPTLMHYRDNRSEWLQLISDAHCATKADAKRLTSIIIHGGRYETWVQNLNVSSTTASVSSSSASALSPAMRKKKLRRFVYDVATEVAALRDKLLVHPRFAWTVTDREKLQRDGKTGRFIDIALLPRIIQACENEVIGLIHRCLFDHRWRIRAKVFDGLIAEPERKGNILQVPSLDEDGLECIGAPSPVAGISTVIRAAEAACLARGWDVRIVEKPLHGLQELTISSIADAREAMKEM